MNKKTGECDVNGTRSCNPCRGEPILLSSGIVAFLHNKARFSRHSDSPVESDW